MMRLYLVRHGKAQPKEKDPNKSLSTQGRSVTRKTGLFLKEKQFIVEAVWHSPKKRAVETAEIIVQNLSCDQIEERDDLNPNDPAGKFPKEIEKLNKELMVVGHLPFLQKLLSLLLTGKQNLDLVEFINSGVVCLEFKENWKILWCVEPKLML
jgi:phosphohistidine phosphatase